MRHRNLKLKLNRFTSWRKSTLISLAKSLITHQSIKTTKAKAKAVKPLIEKLISLAKDNSLTAKRRAFKVLNDHHLVSALFSDIAMRFKDKAGGYTRIIGLENRRGDNAQVVILELTEIIKKKKTVIPKKEKEVKPEEEKKPEIQEKPEATSREPKKPTKNFLGGIRRIFKKERDSL